jgi:hypothetical protein
MIRKRQHPGNELVRCEKCGRSHRSWKTFARCRWPEAVWIAGNPPVSGPCFALLAHCRALTVTLWPDLAEAQKSKAVIDASACGGHCWGYHVIIRLDAGNGRADSR